MLNAIYCENGHRLCFLDPDTEKWLDPSQDDYAVILGEADAQGNPIQVPTFCTDCGAKAISKCPHCGSFIRYDDSRVRYTPNYCTGCGVAFPWVTTALHELGRVTDEAMGLTPEEKDALKQAYPDLTKNTAKTCGAIETVKLYYAKYSPAALAIVRAVLINVMTDEGRQGLGGLFNQLK